MQTLTLISIQKVGALSVVYGPNNGGLTWKIILVLDIRENTAAAEYPEVLTSGLDISSLVPWDNNQGTHRKAQTILRE